MPVVTVSDMADRPRGVKVMQGRMNVRVGGLAEQRQRNRQQGGAQGNVHEGTCRKKVAGSRNSKSQSTGPGEPNSSLGGIAMPTVAID